MFLKKNDQYARVWMKIGDLLVETIVLYVVLEDGSPIELVVTFTAIVTMNAFSCALMMILPDSYTGLTEVIIDIVFDFLFAVAYPMLTVIYCFSSFSLDHVKLTINMEVFPLGAFEREASVIANPAQTDIIYKSLKSLQISSAPLLISRVGVNLVFASRLYHTVGLIRNPEERPTRLYPKRHCLSIAFLLLVVAGLIVFVEESVRTSSIACQAHPECVVKAHRWITVDDGSLIQCPCRTLIDVDIAPKSYEEWMSPVNVTAKVVQLASTGDLRTIKLTNRYLPVLPENLRWCREMQYMSLMYTYTQRIPDWASEFANLQYFYIEGASSSSLVELPDDLFADMTSLTFIHLGSHPQLKQLPSFVGLENLKALVLALLDTLVELPTFDSLYNLKRIELAGMPTLTTLPDLKSLQKLESFIGREIWQAVDGHEADKD
ncbi:uncharacterized protein IUM83_12828 [Phytophthora cinnamomi]|uniref:uncharacterized protein n=1 Tax=Phytophthora cinnamomi TaxID=4785 RepID=UPI0035598C39|nr:hypothetical protein IUM83_12828 [Phytophthora cinnamomi]